MSENTVYLVTGANRGIGRGLAQEFLSRPDTVVIAGVRDTESPLSRSSESLPAGNRSELVIVKIDGVSDTDSKDAVELLKTQYHVDHIDCVVTNAGICNDYKSEASNISAQTMKDHFDVNTLGPLLLFQAARPLLQAAKQPKFVVITSSVGSIGGMGAMPMPLAAYGASKAAVNYVTRKTHFENEWLTAFVLRPGLVQTDMGNAGAREMGMAQAPVTLERSVQGLVAAIDGASREETSGNFIAFDGTGTVW